MDPRSVAAALLDGRPGVVALSGGADSAVAAWACGRAAVRAIHVHHGLPGSDLLATAARGVADALDLPLSVVRVEGPTHSETLAREARWTAVAEELAPGEVVVTGHTKDDQAETVILNLVRGTGPQGLGGMRQRSAIVRPLLGMGRAEVRAIAEEHALPFADDPENRDPRHARTVVREQVLPLLTTLNPAVVDALVRTAAHLAEVEVTPTTMATGPGVVRIPLPLLRVVGRQRAVATVRAAVRAIRPPYPPTAEEVERILGVVDGRRRAELEGGLTVICDRTSLRIGPLPTPPPRAPLVDGMVWGGFTFSVVDGSGGARSPARALLDAGRPWGVRGALPEDRIAMGSGHKAVWDALAEAGVPAPLRAAWPVVTDGEEVGWVPLVRRAPDPRRIDGRYLLVDVVEERW